MDSLVAIKLKGPVLPPILDPEALLGQGLFKSLSRESKHHCIARISICQHIGVSLYHQN